MQWCMFMETRYSAIVNALNCSILINALNDEPLCAIDNDTAVGYASVIANSTSCNPADRTRCNDASGRGYSALAGDSAT